MVINEGREYPHHWMVTEVLPLKKISYDWRFGNYPGLGLVSFKLTEHGGSTTLKLTNAVLEDFPGGVPEFERESCLGGWRYFIGQSLKGYLEKPLSLFNRRRSGRCAGRQSLRNYFCKRDLDMSTLWCGLNRSMQHLTSNMREEDVAYEEVSTEDLLHRSRQSLDVGPLAKRRIAPHDCS